MPSREATFFPSRVNFRVPNMVGTGAVARDRARYVRFGAPIALDGDAFLDAQSIATAGSTTTLLRNDVPGLFGRNITVIASGAATSTVTVIGRDYLQQRMSETMTLNGANTVQGLKAFAFIDSVSWSGTGGTTIDLGFGNRFGLPFRGFAMHSEIKNGAIAANAGTFTAGLAAGTAPTATNADVRGTYLPVTVIPDGTNTFDISYLVDDTNLHGVAQFLS